MTKSLYSFYSVTDLEEDIYVGVLVEEGDVIKELADLLSSP